MTATSPTPSNPTPASSLPPPAATGGFHPAGRHIAALVIGCLLILPGLGLLLGGAGLAITYAVGRDDAGYLSLTLPALTSQSPAITAEDIVVETGPDVPSWVLDRLDLDLRLTARPLASGKDVFLGVAPSADLTAYLQGVAHEQVVGIARARDGSASGAVLRATPGASTVAAPTTQTFWTTSATGAGQQQLSWRVTGGQWAAVIMNADGSAGVAVSATVGVRAGFLLPLALVMLGIGLVLTGVAVALIVRGASGTRPPQGGAIAAPSGGLPGATVEASPVAAPGALPTHPRAVSPVALDARLDEPLSRWLWLVKWFLAIPHYIVLGFLWIAFSVVSIVAFFAILFTGRYPRGLFDFNLGVLRWTWRVSYYASSGGLGTDRYPPFSLDDEPDYPARLDVAYPDRLSRGLVLVKWWLLAIPHYLIVGLLVGGGSWAWTWARDTDGTGRLNILSGGLLGLLVLVAGLSLLFAGHYPRALFDLVAGLNRWVYRVIAYAALMTDVYPPFQLDEGGAEVQPGLPGPPPPPLPPPTLPPPPVADDAVPPDRPAPVS
ncbi:DUF4389 domain-containing protein [Terracoccus sp. 273MFTsu3.1]|uniref:DUF4389 domain-containing protein n=1 Tax=Terracoccus sp. 273MFTsu3.1 TaxID=1172188 RepID=UPI00039C619A|nr:DUF4389 domain-containing protein [Terracoccus sp. 273MFTsu3.1]